MGLFTYLILAFIVIGITILFMKNKKYESNKILIALIGMTIALTVLIFPLYGDNDIISQIVFSILYAAQVIFLNQDFELINAIEQTNIINEIYIILIYTLFLLEPLATATAVMSLLGNNLSKIKMRLSRKKPIMVFSEINKKTLTIARTQYNKKTTILFLGNKEEKEQYRKEISSLKGLILNQNVTNLNLKNSNVTYYLFSEDEESNLNDALEILKKANKRKNIKIYVQNNTQEARIILDSAPKNGARLELINEIDRVIYQHLYNEPIYKYSEDNQISILIVGCGKVGLEFLKAVTWCGQIINHKLNINIIDLKADEIKEKLNIICPELLENYNYNFVQADIYSEKAIKELDALKKQKINYVLVALDTEARNIDVSILLRQYFLNQDTDTYSRMPSINLWIENDDKKAQIDILKPDVNSNFYNLNSFGSVNEMYNEKSIVNSEIEELAIQVHGVYDSQDLKNNLENFYKLEYNKKSSRAVAVHLKYKLYSVLKDSYVGDLKQDLENNLEKVFEQYNENNNEKVLLELVKNEHDRWCAYVRTDGFKSVDKKEVDKYINFTSNTKHFLAKLHPAIVDFKKLDEVEQYLQKDFKTADLNIVNNIEKILKKEIYK